MEHDNNIFIAGERLGDLEAALEFLVFEAEECGCINVSGSIPGHLQPVLMRALKTIEAELEEQGLCACEDDNYQPMRQLFMRIGAARNR
ncbi:MAG: hypothetical protein ABFR53_00520 [Actinomycetota bacterium]